MTPALFEACVHAAHVITRTGEVIRAGAAGLFIMRELGFRRSALTLGLPPFLPFVELGYWLMARNRRRAGGLLRRWPPGYGPDGEPPAPGTRGALAPPPPVEGVAG